MIDLLSVDFCSVRKIFHLNWNVPHGPVKLLKKIQASIVIVDLIDMSQWRNRELPIGLRRSYRV